MEIDIASLSASERYKLMIGCIQPRPIAMVGTISADGKENLAPYSFFSGVGADPMTLLFCPANRSDGSEKDSLRNAKPKSEGGTGVFTVSVAVESYKHEVAAASEELGGGESEFELVGLTPKKGEVVDAPRVLEAPAGFECLTKRVIPLGDGRAGSPNIVLGEVVHMWLEDALLLPKYHVDQDKIGTIGRMGGLRYCSTRDQFELPRGKNALQEK